MNKTLLVPVSDNHPYVQVVCLQKLHAAHKAMFLHVVGAITLIGLQNNVKFLLIEL